MSALSLRPDADPLYARPAPQRPHYATGMLLDAGAKVEDTNKIGATALMFASLTGRTETVELLTARGADPASLLPPAA